MDLPHGTSRLSSSSGPVRSPVPYPGIRADVGAASANGLRAGMLSAQAPECSSRRARFESQGFTDHHEREYRPLRAGHPQGSLSMNARGGTEIASDGFFQNRQHERLGARGWSGASLAAVHPSHQCGHLIRRSLDCGLAIEFRDLHGFPSGEKEVSPRQPNPPRRYHLATYSWGRTFGRAVVAPSRQSLSLALPCDVSSLNFQHPYDITFREEVNLQDSTRRLLRR